MKQRIIAILLITIFCVTLVACSTENEQSEKKDTLNLTTSQEVLTKEDVQKMIDDNNSELKKEILSETETVINAKLNSVELSDAEKDEIKQAILASLESTVNSSRTIVEQQPYQYVTNVTEQHITEQYITNESESNSPPKIEDGTPIAIDFELPYSVTYTSTGIPDGIPDSFTFVIDQAEFYAYNHQNEPYREIPYPYEIRYVISGTVTCNNSDSEINIFDSPFSLVLNPYDKRIPIGNSEITFENNTFKCESKMILNLIPDIIGIK